MGFHVGQKVICVDASPGWMAHGLTLNQTYTIIDLPNAYGVRLFECVVCFPPSIGFKASRFRPVIERKTDISIFTEMLKPRELVRVSND